MKFDIIVIGSGPGGSWSASTLAESASIGLYSDKGASAFRGNLEATQEELIHTVSPTPRSSK